MAVPAAVVVAGTPEAMVALVAMEVSTVAEAEAAAVARRRTRAELVGTVALAFVLFQLWRKWCYDRQLLRSPS